MKEISNVLGLQLLMLTMITVVICEGPDASYNGYIETTWDNAAILVLKGYEDPQAGSMVLGPDSFQSSFCTQDKTFHDKQYALVKGTSTCLDEMKARPEVDARQVDGVPVVNGATYWAHTEVLAVHRYAKFRVCGINGNNVTIEYVVEEDVKPNASANAKNKSGYSFNLEVPRLNEANVFMAYLLKVSGTGLLNYALEWDDTKKHPSWVAFALDEIIHKAGDGVKCKDNFVVDPLLPEIMQVTDEQHKNDGSGCEHICGSADRLFTQEASDQTFYFSNMSPVIYFLNSPCWVEFEEQVREWGGAERDSTTIYSKSYMVEGGAFNGLLTSYTSQKNGGDSVKSTTDANGFTKDGLTCPKYYFMTILSETDGAYHAIGFRVGYKEYSEAPTLEGLKASALSVDELEEKTEVGFLCNLPDNLESTAEGNMNLDNWAW